MDWDKYKKYGNWGYQGTVNFWDKINNSTVTNTFWNEDNVVADVTDSYKELSSERITDGNSN